VRTSWVSIFAFLALISGCAHTPLLAGKDPVALFSEICTPALPATEVTGEVWIVATSPEATGRFPAVVRAASTPVPTLHLEVTNLLGGTVARIQLDAGGLQVFREGRMEASAREQYAGIPLRFGVDLFLGARPCPSEKPRLRYEDEQLIAETKEERFEYGFRAHGAKLWVDSVAWIRGESRIDFSFDRPEDPSGAPQEWQAKSSRGEVRVRWKRRDLLR
jgi:hypothetical protein